MTPVAAPAPTVIPAMEGRTLFQQQVLDVVKLLLPNADWLDLISLTSGMALREGIAGKRQKFGMKLLV